MVEGQEGEGVLVWGRSGERDTAKIWVSQGLVRV